MTTPYDNKILLVNWLGRNTPGNTPAETARLMRQKMRNVGGLALKVTNGLSWQGHLSGDQDDPKAITGVTRVAEWAAAFRQTRLDLHVWGVPRAANRPSNPQHHSPDIPREVEKLAAAAKVEILVAGAKVAGVKSLLLSVEHDPPNTPNPAYWQGAPGEVVQYMTLLRQHLGEAYHIGLIVDGRRNRPFGYYVDPWMPYIDSIHPMIYPTLFGGHQTIEQHIDDVFRNFASYDKPIVPMLQTFAEAGARPTPDEITRQGNAAWTRGAAGISFFRMGADLWSGDQRPQMGDDEYQAIAAITVPRRRPIPITFTWQDLINALVAVAAQRGANWQEWFGQAGLWPIFHNGLREQPYSGPPLPQWPVDPQVRQQISDLLKLNRLELIKAAIEAQRQRKLDDRTAAAQRRDKEAVIGVHGSPDPVAPPPQLWDQWIERLKQMGIRWYVQRDNGDPNDIGAGSTLAWCKRLKQEGIEPIIHYYRQERFPDPLPDDLFHKMTQYVVAGILWAEIGAEPNLDNQWLPGWQNRNGLTDMRHSNPEVIRLLAETWLNDAQRALNVGGRPAFYAFAPTDWDHNNHPLHSSVFFTQKLVAYLAEHHRQETIAIFQRGGWIAVHAATYEQPPDFNPFRPDGTVWDMCLRGYEVVLRAFGDQFGQDLNLDDIPLIATKGGVFTPDSPFMGENRPRLSSDQEHAQKTVEMFRWLEQHSPLRGMCGWCLAATGSIGQLNSQFRADGWFEDINGQLTARPVYEAMRQLRFDHEREDDQVNPNHQIVKLNVPYLSQFDPSASTRDSDCGPTCVAMILNADRPASQHVTVDQLYARHLPHKAFSDFTTVAELVQVMRNEGVEAFNRAYLVNPLTELRKLLDQGAPVIVLVNYDKWADIVGYNFRLGHFVVATGYDNDHVLVHDPLFRRPRRAEGEFFVWRNDRFLDGWGSGQEIGNPNYVAIVPTVKRVSKV